MKGQFKNDVKKNNNLFANYAFVPFRSVRPYFEILVGKCGSKMITKDFLSWVWERYCLIFQNDYLQHLLNYEDVKQKDISMETKELKFYLNILKKFSHFALGNSNNQSKKPFDTHCKALFNGKNELKKMMKKKSGFSMSRKEKIKHEKNVISTEKMKLGGIVKDRAINNMITNALKNKNESANLIALCKLIFDVLIFVESDTNDEGSQMMKDHIRLVRAYSMWMINAIALYLQDYASIGKIEMQVQIEEKNEKKILRNMIRKILEKSTTSIDTKPSSNEFQNEMTLLTVTYGAILLIEFERSACKDINIDLKDRKTLKKWVKTFLSKKNSNKLTPMEVVLGLKKNRGVTGKGVYIHEMILNELYVSVLDGIYS